MSEKICGKSQVEIGALCAARSRSVSGDHLSIRSDTLTHLSETT